MLLRKQRGGLLRPRQRLSNVQNVDVRSQSRDNQSVDLAQLQQLPIFGRQQAGTQTRGNDYANAPKTSLNVRLVGSLPVHDERSAAIIEQAGKQSTYIVGDTIGRSRVSVEQILADRVILDNGGRLETLQLEDIGEDRPALSLVVESSGKTDANEPKETANALQRVKQDPGQLLDYVSITPVLEQGSLQGYRLSPGNQADIFYQAGFQEGDLAVAINGYDLTDMQQASELSSQLQDATEANVTVLRNNERIEAESAAS